MGRERAISGESRGPGDDEGHVDDSFGGGVDGTFDDYDLDDDGHHPSPDEEGEGSVSQAESGPPKRPTPLAWLLRIGAALVVVAAVVIALWVYLRDDSPIEAGDCLTAESLRGQPGAGIEPEAVDCDDEDAARVVLAERETGERESCIEVPGAIAAVDLADPDWRALCVGEIGADPERSINSAEVGDCVVTEGDRPELGPCDAPGARQVGAVLDAPPGVPAFFGEGTAACEEAGITGVEELLTWGLEDPISGSPIAPLRGACLTSPGTV